MTDDAAEKEKRMGRGRVPLVIMRPEDGESKEDFIERYTHALMQALERRKAGNEDGETSRAEDPDDT